MTAGVDVLIKLYHLNTLYANTPRPFVGVLRGMAKARNATFVIFLRPTLYLFTPCKHFPHEYDEDLSFKESAHAQTKCQ